MLIPLAIINHFKPTRELPEDKHCMSFIRRDGRQRLHFAAGSTPAHLAELFPARRPRSETSRAVAQPPAPAACTRGGRALDGRTNR